MTKTRTLTGTTATLFNGFCEHPLHTLIGGATGSGKSTALDAYINSIMYERGNPALILIDPKRVDLRKFAKCRNVIRYADSIEGAREALQGAVEIMERRYTEMTTTGAVKYEGRKIYIVVDELADLVLMDKTLFKPLQRLLQCARASSIFLVLATQCVNREVLPTLLRCNVGRVVCLRCATATASRLMLESSEAVNLPLFGEAIIREPSKTYRAKIPQIDENDLSKIIDFWRG